MSPHHNHSTLEAAERIEKGCDRLFVKMIRWLLMRLRQRSQGRRGSGERAVDLTYFMARVEVHSEYYFTSSSMRTL